MQDKIKLTIVHLFYAAFFKNANSLNPISFKLDKNVLTGPNFKDWLRNLKTVLRMEKIDRASDRVVPTSLPEGYSEDEHAT